MTIRLTIIFLTLIGILSFSHVACGQTKHKSHYKTKHKQNNKLHFDTSKTAIIHFDNSVSYPFSNNYVQASLTQNDIYLIDSLLDKYVAKYNNSLKLNYDSIEHGDMHAPIDLKNNIYKKQLLVVKNSQGEKEVWVNCLCETYDNKWKTEIILIEDGGNCYFNFKINLKTKKYYNLIINGNA